MEKYEFVVLVGKKERGGECNMQNVNTRSFRQKLKRNGFVERRWSGDHLIYERNAGEIISIPVGGKKEINGCMAKRLIKEFSLK